VIPDDSEWGASDALADALDCIRRGQETRWPWVATRLFAEAVALAAVIRAAEAITPRHESELVA